ncbi:hypothetical protein DPMN_072874, partial [Dreissena polymorpha]
MSTSWTARLRNYATGEGHGLDVRYAGCCGTMYIEDTTLKCPTYRMTLRRRTLS